MPKSTKFTQHSIQRFRERFPDVIKNYEGNKLRALADMFYGATENKAIKNNTSFMTYVYTHHGYEPMDFYVNGKALFICREENLVTVVRIDGNGMTSHFQTDNSAFRK